MTIKSKTIIIASIILVTIYLLICTFFYFFQTGFIFFPEKLNNNHKYMFDADFEEINYTVDKNAVINALLFKSKQKSKGIIFYFHGNAGNLNGWGEISHLFLTKGYDFLIFDYRNYGKSYGTFNQENLFNDGLFIYNEIKQKYDEKNIIVYGRSIGTPIASYVASKNNPQMLILETPLFDMKSLKNKYFPFLPNFILKYTFETYTYIKDVKFPVYIFHGTIDNIIPYEIASKLKNYLKSTDKFITIPNGNHNNLDSFKEYHENLDKIISF